MIKYSQRVDIKIALLMVSSHIKTSTTFHFGGVMIEAFIDNWLKNWFSGHIRTYFRHQLGSDVPDLIVRESWITAMRASKGIDQQ